MRPASAARSAVDQTASGRRSGRAPRRWLTGTVWLTLVWSILGGAATAAEPDPAAMVSNEEQKEWLNDDELAVRLATFLWNGSPDARLQRLATQRELHRPDVLRAESARLLAHPRSREFVSRFLAYWLRPKPIATAQEHAGARSSPQDKSGKTRSTMDETQSCFVRLMRKNGSVDELAASNLPLLAERLALLNRTADLTPACAERLPHDFVQHLAAYARGRPLRAADTSAVADILARSKIDGYRVATVIHEVVQSELFQSK